METPNYLKLHKDIVDNLTLEISALENLEEELRLGAIGLSKQELLDMLTNATVGIAVVVGAVRKHLRTQQLKDQ